MNSLTESEISSHVAAWTADGLEVLRALDADLEELEEVAAAIADLRGRIALAVEALSDLGDVGAPANAAPDRFVAAVARLSLAAQEEFDRRLAQRRAAERDTTVPTGDVVRVRSSSARRQRSGGPRATRATRSRAAVASLGARWDRFGASLAPIVERDRFRVIARATLSIGGLAAVAVLVLGVGREGGSALVEDGPTAVASQAVGGTGTPAPAVTLPPPAQDPATSDAPADPVTPATPPTAPSAPPAPAVPPAPVEAPQRVAPPVALRVAAIGAEAPVVIVGLEPDGAMEIPADVRTVGWYEPFPGAGVVPGEPGTAVIAGHVDSRTQGRGVFWPLRDLVPGDVVIVDHEDGTSTRWEVESVVRHPKADLPIEEIFTFEGEERLALVTCGGEFDRSVGSYLDNYVVTAVPLRTVDEGPAQALLPTS